MTPEPSNRLPAIQIDRVVLPGQRVALRLDFEEQQTVLWEQRRQQSRQVVALPEVEGRDLNRITTGTLVDVELLDVTDGKVVSAAVYGTRVVRAISIVRRHPSLLVEGVVEPEEVASDAATLRLARVIYRRAEQSLGVFRMAGIDAELSPSELSYRLADVLGMSGTLAYFLLAAPTARERLGILGDHLRAVHPAKPRVRPARKLPGPADLDETGKKALLPPDIRAAVDRELLGSTGRDGDHPGAAARFLLDLVWSPPTPAVIDLVGAKQLLDDSHLGMEEPKAAILDFLATIAWLRRTGSTALPGRILCLVGPPGVGKTSIGEAIAEAMGRRFEHLSLGCTDDVFLAGADQSYSQARPGEIARRLRQAQVHPSQVVFMLDEIDKVSSAGPHTPLPVLLSLLDPVQNARWQDRFLDSVRLDLSGTFFLCTANETKDIPAPLLDRLEIITIPGYTAAEKVAIGERLLLPRLLAELRVGGEVRVLPAVLPYLVSSGSPSPGVRQLQHRLHTVVSRAIREYLLSGHVVTVDVEKAERWLRKPPARDEPIGFRPGSRDAKVGPS